MLRFAIYSRISFCIMWSDITFLIFHVRLVHDKWRYWASSEHVICVQFIPFWTFNSWITCGVRMAFSRTAVDCTLARPDCTLACDTSKVIWWWFESGPSQGERYMGITGNGVHRKGTLCSLFERKETSQNTLTLPVKVHYLALHRYAASV